MDSDLDKASECAETPRHRDQDRDQRGTSRADILDRRSGYDAGYAATSYNEVQPSSNSSEQLPGAEAKSPGILDFPNELLSKVCWHISPGGFDVHEAFLPEFFALRDQARDVQNFRLACRRFASVGACFLVSRVKVSIYDPASVRRLEEISLHQTISKGVIVARAYIRLYDTSLVENTAEFARQRGESLRRICSAVEASLYPGSRSDVVDSVGLGGLEAFQAMKVKKAKARKWKAILDSWDPWMYPYEPSPSPGLQQGQQGAAAQDSAGLRLLRKAHERFCNICEGQERLRRDGEGLRRIGEAMARMPNAKWLEICQPADIGVPMEIFNSMPTNGDGDGDRDIGDSDACRLLAQSLSPLPRLRPSSNEAVERFRSLSEQLLVDLPVALHRAGSVLTKLFVDIPVSLRVREEGYPQAGLAHLTAAVQHLKSFSVILKDREGDLEGGAGHRRAALSRYLGAVLDTDSLEDLGILSYVSGDWSLSMGTFEVLPLVPLRRRPRLWSLTLEDTTVGLADLAGLLSLCDARLERLQTDSVRLSGGSHRDLLALLREHYRTARPPTWTLPRELMGMPLGVRVKVLGSPYLKIDAPLTEERLAEGFASLEDTKSGGEGAEVSSVGEIVQVVSVQVDS